MSNGRPRRGSIFGGLLLIGIGTVLLLSQFRPEVRLGEVFLRYWPVLLILWGLAKLADYFLAQRAGQAAPRFTGGEFFLLLFLLAIVGAVTGVVKIGRENPGLGEIFDLPIGESYSTSEEVKTTQAVKENSQVAVTNYRGDVTVHPEEGAEIRVVAKKTVRSWNPGEAERAARGITVAISETSEGYDVRPQLKDQGYKKVRLDLEVHVPRTASVAVHTDRGDIQVSGLGGNVAADSQRGDIQIHSAGGDVRVETKGGEIRVVGVRGGVKVSGRTSEIEVADVGGEALIEGEFSGVTRLQNVAKETRFLTSRTDLTISQLPGRAEVGIGHLEIYDTPGSVSLTAKKGKDIVMENIGGRIQIENRRGNVELRFPKPPKEEVEISNQSGSVELVVPGNSSFEVLATSRRGEVESDFQGPELKLTEEHNTSTLQGKVGNRGPRVQLKTTYGNVRLRKGSD